MKALAPIPATITTMAAPPASNQAHRRKGGAPMVAWAFEVTSEALLEKVASCWPLAARLGEEVMIDASPTARSSVTAISLADENRSWGSRAKARPIHSSTACGKSRRSELGSSNSPRLTATTSSPSVPPSNGRLPVKAA